MLSLLVSVQALGRHRAAAPYDFSRTYQQSVNAVRTHRDRTGLSRTASELHIGETLECYYIDWRIARQVVYGGLDPTPPWCGCLDTLGGWEMPRRYAYDLICIGSGPA